MDTRPTMAQIFFTMKIKSKKFILVLAIGFFLCQKIYSQCGVTQLFPFNFGISRLEALTEIGRNNSLAPKDELNHLSSARWEKLPYLKDSFLMSQYHCKILKNDCLLTEDASIRLGFVNDKLFDMIIYLTFLPDQMDMCLKNYDLITQELKKHYNFTSEPFIQDGEQLGMSMTFTPYDASKTKIVEISIGYSVHYNYREGIGITNEVHSYGMSISFLNMNYSPFDSRGWMN